MNSELSCSVYVQQRIHKYIKLIICKLRMYTKYYICNNKNMNKLYFLLQTVAFGLLAEKIKKFLL